MSLTDPEPVIAICAAAMVLFGGTLLWPGKTFAINSFAPMATVVAEETAGLIAVTLGLAAALSLLGPPRATAVLCILMVAAFAFLGTQFVLSGMNSTGNTYYVYAAGCAWSFWRISFRGA